MNNKASDSLKTDHLYSIDYYNPDQEFRLRLKYRCEIFFDTTSYSSSSLQERQGFVAKFFHILKTRQAPKFLSIPLLILVASTTIYFVNLNNSGLDNDFVLTQVYAENPQTNLMPFMMLSSGYYAAKTGTDKQLNPAMVPIVANSKKFNYSHVGYELETGQAMERCSEHYPFPDGIKRIEGYEFLDEKGDIKYKIFGITKSGRLENYMLLNDGALLKVNADGSLSKGDLNQVKTKIKLADIIGQMPKTIELRKISAGNIMLSWQKKVFCGDEVENMLIQVVVDSKTFKIKTLNTFLNTAADKNQL